MECLEVEIVKLRTSISNSLSEKREKDECLEKHTNKGKKVEVIETTQKSSRKTDTAMVNDSSKDESNQKWTYSELAKAAATIEQRHEPLSIKQKTNYNVNRPVPNSAPKTTNSNEDFKFVQTRRKKRKPEITGNNVNSKLKAVAKMSSIYVSRIDADTTRETISTYLKENGLQKFEVKDGFSKYPEIYKSYIVTVPVTDLQKIKQKEFWPEGANISNFLFHLQKKDGKSK